MNPRVDSSPTPTWLEQSPEQKDVIFHFCVGEGRERSDSGLVYCVRCGAKNPDDAPICMQCGKPLLAFDRARTGTIDLFVVLGNPFAVYAVFAGIIIVGYLFLAQIMGWKILGEATHYFGLVGALIASIPAAYILTERRKR